jgi:hypothetical protein
MYTEFISSEGLIRDAAKSVQKLDIYEYERPVGIQIFGYDIDSMREATKIIEKTNPDIIDINFGCPVKKVTCKGAGAGEQAAPNSSYCAWRSRALSLPAFFYCARERGEALARRGRRVETHAPRRQCGMQWAGPAAPERTPKHTL